MKMESFVYAENPNRGKTSAFKPCFLPVISMTYWPAINTTKTEFLIIGSDNNLANLNLALLLS